MEARVKHVVLSAVNLVEGGPLTVLLDAAAAFDRHPEVRLTLLVHSKDLVAPVVRDSTTIIGFPSIKRSWLRRLKFEFHDSLILSRSLKPDIWFSLHDVSARVESKVQLTYCHNPAPFYRPSFKDLFYSPKFFLFTLFYRFLYKLNISANDAVVVQQGWLGDYLVKELGAKKCIVAKPRVKVDVCSSVSSDSFQSESKTLFYPALPRTFKNFELLLRTFEYLSIHHVDVYKRLKLILTIDEAMGMYSRKLVKKYKSLERIKFIGKRSLAEVHALIRECDAVVFPSKLETWGLPISEAKEFGKSIFLADLPYAHETLGSYDRVCWIGVDSELNFVNLLCQYVAGKNVFGSTLYERDSVCQSWSELVDKVLSFKREN